MEKIIVSNPLIQGPKEYQWCHPMMCICQTNLQSILKTLYWMVQLRG